MPKLTYWVAECETDSQCYSIIDRTKKGAIAQLEKVDKCNRYGKVHKRTIEYKDAFDLFDWVTGEGGGRVYGGHVEDQSQLY
jgi:hypothetical protein